MGMTWGNYTQVAARIQFWDGWFDWTDSGRLLSGDAAGFTEAHDAPISIPFTHHGDDDEPPDRNPLLPPQARLGSAAISKIS
jgi:hypothetical protein